MVQAVARNTAQAWNLMTSYDRPMFSCRTHWKLDPNRLTLAYRAALHEGRDKQLIDLTVSNPTLAGIEYDHETIFSALQDPKTLTYDPQPNGLRAARQAIADYYSKSHLGMPHPSRGGGSFDLDDIILTTSTSEGYSFIFRLLCNPGEEILVPKPSYPLFDFLADLNDVKLIGYPLIYDQGWQIDFPSLERVVTERTRAVVVVHPNNPTGSYVSCGELRQLNEISRRHDLAIIADEVFLDYRLRFIASQDNPSVPHKAREYESLAHNHHVLTFTLSGLSKISALPQMKLAWIVVNGPEPHRRVALERLEVIADTYLSLNTPVQLAAKVLLDQRRSVQPQLMSRIRENLTELDRQLASQRSCERLIIDGGWYAILRVPVTQSDEDLAIALLKNCSVLVHPGHFYDFPRDGYLILSLITPSAPFRLGLSRLLEFVRNL